MTFSTGARYGGPQRRVSSEFAAKWGIECVKKPQPWVTWSAA